MPELDGVPFSVHLDGGEFTESVTDKGPQATVPYLVDWRDRYRFANALMGSYEGAQGRPTYVGAHRYPDSPNMFCLGVPRIKGLGERPLGTSGFFDCYAKAIVTANYGVPSYDDENQSNPDQQLDPEDPITYCKMSVRLSGKGIEIAEGKLEFEDNSKAYDGSMHYIEAESEITLEFPKIPYLPWRAIKPYIGRLNDVPMFGCDRGQLLLSGMDTDDAATSEGRRGQQVVLTYLWQDRDWNTVIDETGAARIVRYRSGKLRPFLYRDHREIFR